MEIVDINSVTLHELTKTHPVMTQEQFDMFREDIRKNGQIEPVLVYRGKVVDGRHRTRALEEIGETKIKIHRLPNNMTIDAVKDRVDSSEVRRHQTPTQLAIRGYRLYKSGMKQPDAAKKSGCSLANLKHVVAIEKLGRIDIVDRLERGYKINVSDDTRFAKMSDSLLAIVGMIKREALEVKEYERSDNAEEPNGTEQINAISMLVDSWSVEMKKRLIARLYASIDES